LWLTTTVTEQPNTVTNQQQTGAQLIEWENLVQNIVCLRSQLKIEAAAARENEGKTRREKKKRIEK